MYKTAVRSAPRRIVASRSALKNTSSSGARRFLSTAPPSQKSRTWKSSAARWGLAIGGIYFYNTSPVFAEGPEVAIQRLDDSIHHIAELNQPTVDAVVEEKRKRQAQLAAEEQRREATAAAKATVNTDEQAEGEEGMGGLEEEADQQGAFNPETGEINWDCPCLGGMAHGPCGEEFKAAFSCFVYSNEEPKGMECIDKFKGMQDCFRQHPEMYGSELEDDEDDVEEELHARDGTQPAGELQPDSQSTAVGSAQKGADEGGNLLEKSVHDASASQTSQQTSSRTAQAGSNASDGKSIEFNRDRQRTAAQNEQRMREEDEDLVPKVAYDASAANKASK